MPLVALLIVGAFTAARFGVPGIKSAPRELKDAAIANGRPPAPDFTLTNQLGQQESLSSFRGKPVAMTFIYTNCADVCPLIAWNMHLAYDQLGNDAKNVALVAVSVDPEHDSPAQIRAFSDERQVTSQWHFFTGGRPALEDVWRAYNIPAQAVDAAGNPLPQGSDLSAASPEEIEHAAPMYLIDKQGRLRAMMPVNFEADTLANNLRVLLAE